MKLDILQEAIERCLDEMYRYSQPSITLKEFKDLSIEEKEKTGEPQPVYRRYYLSPVEYKTIVEKYINAYHLNSYFKEHCDLIISDMIKGCSKDKYIPANGDEPGHRGYEKVPSLDTVIGKENLDKVVKFIEERKNFYRTDQDESAFRFNVMNFSPTSNKQDVIDYWKEQGVELQIEDREDENECWEVHYYGMTWDEYRREN